MVLCRADESSTRRSRAHSGVVVVMTDVPMISLLSDDELDAVMGGDGRLFARIFQNTRGLDNIVDVVRHGRSARSAAARHGVSIAIAGASGAARSSAGGDGGTNTITDD